MTQMKGITGMYLQYPKKAATPQPNDATNTPQSLFVEPKAPCRSNSQVCKCCTERKVYEDFYKTPTGYMRRCKACGAADRKLSKLWQKTTEAGLTDYDEWPAELRTLVQQFVDWFQKGGKIDYSGSVAPELVEQYAIYNPAQFTVEPASDMQVTLVELRERCAVTDTSTEDLRDLMSDMLSLMLQQNIRISMLEGRALAPLQAKRLPGNTNYGACLNPSGADLQERKRLMDRINNDPELLEVFGRDELSNLIYDLTECFRTTIRQGYVDPYQLRKIVLAFEEHQQPLNDDMLVIYRKFIKPGLETAQLQDDYGTMAEIVRNVALYNFYEEPWESIPHLE